ncbi:MAG: CDP-diacylglycerol--glycerol-3-phosphate 3-phosphatidyltransferase [Clostridia bacterium]|nr:CDP-diacylglycerol--glycerol-3-phosphate 3-phosphatidyltransferase [Clostridia bacterium]
MNLPNRLTLSRIILAPVVLVLMCLDIPNSEPWISIAIAFVFAAASITDLIDGKYARKHNLITDFGKFMDPLADKFMVMAAMLGIIVRYDWFRPVFVWAFAIVIFRELAVTSMRLIVSNKAGIVVAAAWLGKIKTTLQIVCVLTVVLEPVIFGWFMPSREWHILSYITAAAMTVMTVWSGIDYLKTYWKYIGTDK